ncbi:hypothetical protein F1559_000510 [Cyanidiococcus yangmingshanensis]|uniref:Uncharacterized protein n=1 Tax=Cyanidiococcus yangmingshanensis TaxID=2690220 RepID=A0A7J7ID07_9RHOD|nr:hypothetical protein F1559_000510 [Cyanidiococcus yangmingshanensis]
MDEQENLPLGWNWNDRDDVLDGDDDLSGRKWAGKQKQRLDSSKLNALDSGVARAERRRGEAVSRRRLGVVRGVAASDEAVLGPMKGVGVANWEESHRTLSMLIATATALWGSWKEAMIAQRGWPTNFAASTCSFETLWCAAQRYDMVLALVALTGALHIFGVLGQLIAFSYYVGVPLHRTWKILALEASGARQEERLRYHLCFWSMACMLWAVRYAMIRSIVPAWQVLWGPFPFGRGVAAVCERVVSLGFHLTLNVLMWWQPRCTCPGEPQDFRGAAWLWTQTIQQWAVPRLSRLWQRVQRQLQRTG